MGGSPARLAPCPLHACAIQHTGAHMGQSPVSHLALWTVTKKEAIYHKPPKSAAPPGSHHVAVGAAVACSGHRAGLCSSCRRAQPLHPLGFHEHWKCRDGRWVCTVAGSVGCCETHPPTGPFDLAIARLLLLDFCPTLTRPGVQPDRLPHPLHPPIPFKVSSVKLNGSCVGPSCFIVADAQCSPSRGFPRPT